VSITRFTDLSVGVPFAGTPIWYSPETECRRRDTKTRRIPAKPWQPARPKEEDEDFNSSLGPISLAGTSTNINLFHFDVDRKYLYWLDMCKRMDKIKIFNRGQRQRWVCTYLLSHNIIFSLLWLYFVNKYLINILVSMMSIISFTHWSFNHRFLKYNHK